MKTKIYKITWESNLTKELGVKIDKKMNITVSGYYLKQNNTIGEKKKTFVPVDDFNLYQILLYRTFKKYNLKETDFIITINDVFNIEESTQIQIFNFVYKKVFKTDKDYISNVKDAKVHFRVMCCKEDFIEVLVKMIEKLKIEFIEFDFELFKNSFKPKNLDNIKYEKIKGK